MTFVLADAVSALVSVPLVVGLGYGFWGHISQAHRTIRIAELVILAVLLLAAGIAALRRQLRA